MGGISRDLALYFYGRPDAKTAVNPHRRHHGLFIRFVFLMLQQVDLALTLFAVSQGLTERNPFMAGLLQLPLLLIIMKQIIPLLIAWFVPYRILLPAIGFLILLTIWNAVQLIVHFL
ncbi:MAG: DUF5658 family protein [Dehalococcoidales bacterium]|nr:DUF5658 family protein [Dehalococcoidales bacterium]